MSERHIRKPVYERLKLMPPVSHYPDRTEPFDWDKSQLIAYINRLMNETGEQMTLRRSKRVMEGAIKKKVIVFDQATRLWRGCGYALE